MRHNVTRKAILIEAPGGDGNPYLNGLKADIRGIAAHLRSQRGGCWYDQEITILHNPTADQVLAATQFAKADYLLIYFCGHGYTDGHSVHRMLCLRGHSSIADIALIQSASPRIHLFSDACRTFTGDAIGSIPLPDDQYDNFTGEPSEIRKLYDAYIQASPHGKVIIHGTQSGNSAGEASTGGHFTQALLHVAGRMNIKSGSQVVGIEQVLYHVLPFLKNKVYKQEPQVIYHSGDLKVPFCVAMPLPFKPVNVLANNLVFSNNTTPTDWGQVLLGLGLLVAVAYVAES
ncbi:MAG: hypothetical protein ABI675_25745 [Chitinophagaceae bacterium]